MSIVACVKCGARNRVDEERADGAKPVCGRCGAELAAGGIAGKPLEVTDRTFEEQVLLGGSVPLLLDCWAPWCPPCRMLAPAIDALAAEAGGRYQVAKLNTEENPLTANRLGIRSLPTLLIFKNGKVVDQLVGLQPKHAIAARLAAHV